MKCWKRQNLSFQEEIVRLEDQLMEKDGKITELRHTILQKEDQVNIIT